MDRPGDASAPLAAYGARDGGVRFQALCRSTFAQLQERNRLAHEFASSADESEHAFLRTFPYFARDGTILKYMHALMEALETWHAVPAEESADLPTSEQLDAWTASVARLMEQLAQTNQVLNDPRGCEMLQELRRAHPHALEQRASPPAHRAPADEPSDVLGHVDQMPCAALSVPRASRDDTEAAAYLAQQNLAWRDQDDHLDNLHLSITRQHALSLQMNEELELQSGLIGNLDNDVERTGLRLGGASTRLGRLRESLRDKGSFGVIIVLIIILVLLIALFK